MLPPDSRLALLNALRPPSGLQLGHAVATTYTLDLETAMTLPVAFAQHRVRDPEDAIAVAAALSDTAELVDIFCQSGAVGAPVTRSSLYTLVEAGVHPVSEPGRLFHPKVWLLRFDDADGAPQQLRLLVLSRNLTADRSWDLCLQLEGVPGTRPDAGNAPINDLLRWCADHATPPLPAARRQRVEALAEMARRASWDLPADATALTFTTLGTGRRTTVDLHGTRQLVVSPFLTPVGITTAAGARGAVVISRQETLDAQDEATLEGLSVHVVDEAASLADDPTADDAPDSPSGILVGLHAKLFVAESGRQTRVTVGSMNATAAGLQRNVEFVAQLTYPKSRMSIDAFLDAGGFGKVLVPYGRQPVRPADAIGDRLNIAIEVCGELRFDAQAASQPDGWSLSTRWSSVEPADPEVRLTVEPITVGGRRVDLAAGRGAWEGLVATQVTPFHLVTATLHDQSVSVVVKAKLTGGPANRFELAIAEQLADPAKFQRWLMLLLGDAGQPWLAGGSDGDTAGQLGSWSALGQQGLFEMLITAAADRPDRLHLAGRVITAMQEQSLPLPDDFVALWDIVAPIAKRTRRTPAGSGAR